MSLNLALTRQLRPDFDFRKLLSNEPGWSDPPFALGFADAETKDGPTVHRAPVASRSGIHAAVSVLAAEDLLIRSTFPLVATARNEPILTCFRAAAKGEIE